MNRIVNIKLMIIPLALILFISSCGEGMGLLNEDLIAEYSEYSDGSEAAPKISIDIPGGIYTTDQNVTITSNVSGANIYYTTDGSDPDEGSTLYTGPIPINGFGTKKTIKAIAMIDGTIIDTMVSEEYTIINSIQTLDSSGDVGRYTSMAVDGSNIYISYYDGTAINRDLKFIKSTDGGATWDTPQVVDSTGSVGQYTSIALNGTDVYISYYDIFGTKLKFAKSTDGGETWPAPNIKTVDDTASVGRFTSIAADGTNIYISYYDETLNRLLVVRSTDNGDNWELAKEVDAGPDVGWDTSIAVRGQFVYVSYYDYGNSFLKFARSEDSGANWLTPIEVDTSGNVGGHTSIAVDGSKVYISYYDDNICDPKLAISTDDGDNWTSQAINSADIDGLYTSITVSGPDIFISYRSEITFDLKFARSDDGGNTWSLSTVDSTGVVGAYSSVAINGPYTYISYYDDTTDVLKLAFSNDGGFTW